MNLMNLKQSAPNTHHYFCHRLGGNLIHVVLLIYFQRYLETYGYMQRKDRVERSLPEENYDERADSLRCFQEMHGLPQTG